jgi:hypothetical protein
LSAVDGLLDILFNLFIRLFFLVAFILLFGILLILSIKLLILFITGFDSRETEFIVEPVFVENLSLNLEKNDLLG